MIVLHCPHPDPLHDEQGCCAVLHCGCELFGTLVRCACPYQDCRTLVPNPDDICLACGPCVAAFEMERP